MKTVTPVKKPVRGHRKLMSTATTLSVMAAALAASFAQAQQAAKPAKDDPNQLETIVVTATKRAEPLQLVPIAITVLGGEQLEQSNLNTLGAITTQTPTVNFRAGASNKDTSLFIRGVGTITTSPGVEPTVSTIIDGVVSARPGQATMDLLEVDRIEVLRGPQGTLFGKNASAGVINIVTKAPSTSTERFIDIGHFQGNENRLRLGASGELSPNARGSVSFLHGDYDGNVNNVALGTKVNGYKRDGGRVRLDFNADRDVKVSLIGDYMKAKDNAPTGVVVKTTLTAYPTGVVTANPVYAAALLPVVASSDNRSINSEMETRVSDTNSGLSAQVDWDAGSHAITSITAYRKWENTQFQDQDRLSQVSRNFVQQADTGNLSFNQTTQELRAASAKGKFFDYVVGLFYMNAKNDERYQRDVTRCAGSTSTALASGIVPCSAGSITVDNGVANYGIRSKSTSVFGEGTFNFSPGFRGIAGLRWTTDDLSFYHSRVSTQAAAIPGVQPTSPRTEGNTKESGVGGRIGPQIDLSKDAMLYATYSRGYKGPAYNAFFNMLPFTGTTPRDSIALKPEKSDSYEVGLKTTALDNRLRFNVAAFDSKYKNYQANLQDLVVGTVVTRLVNAGEVSTKGIELDFAFKVSREFTLSGAAANIKARIDKFNCPVGATASCNVDGKPLPFSPDSRYNLRGNYKMPLSNGLMLDLGADYNWQSRVIFDISQSPDTVQEAYGIFNATVTLSDAAKGWRVSMLGKNLGNKSYATALATGGTFAVRFVPRDDQRYFGITARYDF